MTSSSGQPLPITYHDIPEKTRPALNRTMGNIGRTAKKHFLDSAQASHDEGQAKLADPSSSAEDIRSAKGAVSKYQAVKKYGKSGQPVTMEGATDARVGLVHDAEARARRHGHTVPHGAMWYPQHNEDITRAAQAHGFEPRDAITASAVMSPQNAPDNEKASVVAHMDALKNHSVTVTPELHQAVKRVSEGKVGLDEHVGSTVRIGDLHPDQVAWLSHTKARDQAAPNTGADLFNMGKGGGKGQIAKQVNVLNGSVHRDQAINPHDAPKVATYNHNIQAAQFDSPEVGEYAHRWHHLMTQDPGQQRIDAGHNNSSHGVLDPKRSVQDTWMNAVNHTSQPNMVAPGTSANIAKTIGSEDTSYVGSKSYKNRAGSKVYYGNSADVSPQELHHAWGQHADEQAVHQLTAGRDFTLGGHASQAPAWTEMRIQGDKDKGFTGAMREHRDQMWKDSQPAKGQGTLFSAGKAGPKLNKQQFLDHHEAKYQDALSAGREVDAQIRSPKTRPQGVQYADLKAQQGHLDHEAATREPDIQGTTQRERKAQGKLW